MSVERGADFKVLVILVGEKGGVDTETHEHVLQTLEAPILSDKARKEAANKSISKAKPPVNSPRRRCSWLPCYGCHEGPSVGGGHGGAAAVPGRPGDRTRSEVRKALEVFTKEKRNPSVPVPHEAICLYPSQDSTLTNPKQTSSYPVDLLGGQFATYK